MAPIAALSLRTHLLLLVAAVLVPLGALVVYSVDRLNERAVITVGDKAQDAAEFVATDLEHFLERSGRWLERLAQRPELAALDPSRCGAVLADFIDVHRRYAGAATVDAEGRVVCLASAGGSEIKTGLSVADRDWFRRSQQNDRLQIDGPFMGRVTGKRVIALSLPLPGVGGRRGVIALGLDLAEIQAGLERFAFSAETLVTVTDGEGRVLARTRDAQTWFDRPDDAPPVRADTTRADEKILRGVGADGIERAHAAAAVPSAGWLVRAGIPVAPVLAANRQALMRNYAVIAALALGLAALALWLRRRILAPIEGLAVATSAVAAGASGIRIPEPPMPELRPLAGRFNAMLEAREAAEARLRESEAAYRSLVRELPAITYTARLDADFSTTFVSPQIASLGFTELEWLADPTFWVKHLHPEDRQRVLAAFAQGVAAGGAVDCEYRLLDRGGQVHWFRDAATVVRGEDGQPRLLQGVLHDISDRKQAERRMAEENEAMGRLKKIGDLFIHDGDIEQILGEIVEAAIAVSAADFGSLQLLDARSGALRLLAQRGFPEAWVAFWHNVPEGQGACGAALQRGERVVVEDIEQGSVFSGEALEIHRRAGVRAVQSTPLTSRSGRLLGMFSTHYRKPCRPEERALRLLDLIGRQAADIIERKQGEEALRASEEKYRSLFENALNGVAYCRLLFEDGKPADWVHLEVNRAFEHLTGLADVLGRRASEVIPGIHHSDPKLLAAFARVVASGRPERFEIHLRALDQWLSVSAFSPGAEHFVAVFDAITESKRAEEQLRALAQRLEAAREAERSRIAREVHDELGQALTGLKLDLALLVQHWPAAAPAVAPQVEAMNRLIDATVQAVRRISYELRPGVLDALGLTAAVEWQCREFQTRSGIACSAELQENLSADAARATALFRILQELLTNVVRHARASAVAVRLEEREGRLRLTVADDGIGLDAGTRREPDGLGLLGVRERAEQFGGRVEVDSAPERGTCVSVEIPRAEEKA